MARRQRETPALTWQLTQAELDAWRPLLQEPDADELAGRYTLPPPPEGWRRWIAGRWPTALDGAVRVRGEDVTRDRGY